MAGEKKRGLHYAWWIMIGCCFMQAGALGLLLNSAGVFFNPICTDLGLSQASLALYLTCYSWATCVGMLLVARWFSRVDCRLTMSVAIILVCAATAAMGFYNAPWQWYVSGVIYGLAGAFIFVVPGPILIGNWFVKRTGFATGLAMAFSGIGAAVWSPVFTAIIAAVGWRMAYFIEAAVTLVMVLPFTALVFRFKPEDKGMHAYGWEPAGEAEAADEGETMKHGVTMKKALPTLAFVCLFIFAGLSSMYAGYNNQFPNYAITIGETAMFGASIVSAASIGNIVSKIVMGWLTDKIGIHKATIIQCVLVAISMLMFLFVRNTAVLLVAAFLFGFMNCLVSVSTPMLIQDAFGNKNYSEIFAMVRLGTGIIGGVGISFVAFCYDSFGDYTIAFIIGCCIALLSIVMVLILVKAKKKIVWD